MDLEFKSFLSTDMSSVLKIRESSLIEPSFMNSYIPSIKSTNPCAPASTTPALLSTAIKFGVFFNDSCAVINEISNIVSCAESLNIKLLQHDNISDTLFIYKIQSYSQDLFIVIDYKIIPQNLLSIPKIGSINLHASYLPNYKGASPIQRALMNNDKFLGITTFFINNQIDEGNIILQQKIKINETITYSEAYNSLSFQVPN